MNPNAKLANSLPPPLLDRVLGSKLLELSKATRFAMQTVQEEAQKLGCQPKGRHLLWTVFEKFKMEKDKGVALTQNHLLNLKVPSGSDVRSLEEFRNRFDFAWHALELTERPSETCGDGAGLRLLPLNSSYMEHAFSMNSVISNEHVVETPSMTNSWPLPIVRG